MDLSLAVSLVSATVSVVALGVSTRQHLWVKRLDQAMEATDAVVDAIQDLREAVWAAALQTPDAGPDIEESLTLNTPTGSMSLTSEAMHEPACLDSLGQEAPSQPRTT